MDLKLIEPQEIEIDKYKFIISKLPATVGREVISKYPLSSLPKIGDYEKNEEIMIKMLSYCCRITDAGQHISLQNKALIDNHVPDWEVLVKLEKAMLEYNCSFFQNGKLSSLVESWRKELEPKATKMLTIFWEKLSQMIKQHSTN